MSARFSMISQPSTSPQPFLQAALNTFLLYKHPFPSYQKLQAQIKKTDALQAMKGRKSSGTSSRMPSQTSYKTAPKTTPPTPMV
jgi:hypothetical protein